MCPVAKHVRVVCLSIAVWRCMTCFCVNVVCCVCVCGVECVCGSLLVPHAELYVFACFCASLCVCVFCL